MDPDKSVYECILESQRVKSILCIHFSGGLRSITLTGLTASMPHLKVNVNGTKYSISGLTRKTCSSQILCALAKVDAKLKANKCSANNAGDEVTGSRRQSRKPTPQQVREANQIGEEIRKNFPEEESKPAEQMKDLGSKRRLTRKLSELDKKGIQAFNESGFWASDALSEIQQNCLKTQQCKSSSKEKVLEDCLQNVEELSECPIIRGGIEQNSSDEAKETEHDTGISEFHSDSSFEHHNTTCIPIETNGKQILNEKGVNSSHSAGASTCTTEYDVIVAQLIGSETDDEYSSFTVDTSTEKLYNEVEKMRGDLRLTEALLAEKNRAIEVLLLLMDAVPFETAGKDALDDITNVVDDRIQKLKQSIRLSENLYEYQKKEMQANTLELERVESAIRRKR